MRTPVLSLLVLSLLFAACSPNNVTVDNSLGRFFDSAGVKGTFALFDNGEGHFTIYNLPRYRDSAYSPNETFDIVESLVAFQTGAVKDDKEIMVSRDSTVVDSVTGDSTGTVKVHHTLAQAFQATGWILNQQVFYELEERIGADTLNKWVDSLHYGNAGKYKNPLAMGYVYGLKITPDEQLGLIKKLYFNQLPFDRRSHDLVKYMMKNEENSSYKLDYQAARILGACTRKGMKDYVMGWLVGWVEENKHPYFFVLNFEDPDYRVNVEEVGLPLLKRILASQGFFQGTK